jgi:type IV secretory pathway VirJ component
VTRFSLAIAVALLLPLAACIGLPTPSSIGDRRLSGMPLIEAPGHLPGDTLVVMYTGDNGWWYQMRDVTRRLNDKGASVVGVSTVRYFLSRKSPERAAADLTAVIDYYTDAWKRPKVILVGYSFGADALPLFLDRLSPETRSRVRLVAMINPTDYGDLAFRGSSWFDLRWPSARDLAPALRKLAGPPMLCIQSDRDPHAACSRFPQDLVHTLVLPTDHHLTGQRSQVADAILAAAR